MAKNDWPDGNILLTNIEFPSDIQLALAYVTKVFREARESGKHQSGDWRKQGFEGNYNHFLAHADVLDDEGTYEAMVHPERFGDGEDHLANLCCRALLLLQLREEQR